ncbi:MAG: bifunctional 2-C-methyl-D-erythritol 4-phosphate cytidylyltransferase/2-C-methyl-D-erythritol 2,4-cyclodiphosphate synthase [Propylenella sp.]
MPANPVRAEGGVAALVVAAGRGSRAFRDLPKQYAKLGGKTVLQRTLEALLSHAGIDPIQVVIGEADEASYRDAVRGLPRVLPPVRGGATRQQSVRNGLEALASWAPRLVLVHDAARPFIAVELIERVIAACDGEHGAIPVAPVTETLKRIDGGIVAATVPRDALATAQTPQGFPFDALLDAHRRAASSGMHDLTDDAAVAALAGLAVRAVEGDRGNVKLTQPADFAAAERMLRLATETRTGQGFDVHRFGPGDSVWLCGVEIPHTHGLTGHSDADAGLHALTDALLGTIGDGDIGEHFPPSDPQWKGVSSDRFVTEAVRRVRARGGRVVNVDVTLVCEAPRIGPHRKKMQARIAELVGVSADRVGVKATTNEKMGFIGRGEGIAALAIATVSLPAEA